MLSNFKDLFLLSKWFTIKISDDEMHYEYTCIIKTVKEKFQHVDYHPNSLLSKFPTIKCITKTLVSLKAVRKVSTGGLSSYITCIFS